MNKIRKIFNIRAQYPSTYEEAMNSKRFKRMRT